MWKVRAEKEDVVVEDCSASSNMVTRMQFHSSSGGAEAASQSPFYSARIEGLSELRTKFDNQLGFDVESSKFSWTEVSSAATASRFEHIDHVQQMPSSVVFEEMKLQHPEWGPFFRRQPYELEIGAKIAEGGQAEIFRALGWNKYDPQCAPENNKKISLVVKVFKQGFSLLDLQRLWPPGIALAAIPHRYFGGVHPKGIGRYMVIIFVGRWKGIGRYMVIIFVGRWKGIGRYMVIIFVGRWVCI